MGILWVSMNPLRSIFAAPYVLHNYSADIWLNLLKQVTEARLDGEKGQMDTFILKLALCPFLY